MTTTKTPSAAMMAHYSAGRAACARVAAGESLSELSYDGALDLADSDDLVLASCFEAGLAGHAQLVWTRATRIGQVPPCGQSYNFRDGCRERGVSCLTADEASHDCDGSYAALNPGKVIEVAGWLLPWTGSDGEPLLVGAIEL